MAESFYTDADVVGAAANFDASNLTLGDALEFDVSGTVTHIRFRSTPTLSGGSYIGALFPITANDPPGAPPSPLGQATYGALTGGAWETVALSPPIAVAANTPYRPAFFTSVARYMTKSGFHSGGSIKRGHITSLGQGATSGGFTVRNGVFRYATGLNFPSDDAGGTSFLVDVIFEPDADDPAEGTAALGLDLAVAATGAAPAEGAAALGLDLAVAATGAAPAEGSADLGLGLAVAAQGAARAQGSVTLTLGLGVSATGARDSLGAAALGLGLNVVSAGERASLGASALGINLAMAAHGVNGNSGRPVSSFPWASRPVSGYPWTPRPVRSFEEVTEQ